MFHPHRGQRRFASSGLSDIFPKAPGEYPSARRPKAAPAHAVVSLPARRTHSRHASPEASRLPTPCPPLSAAAARSAAALRPALAAPQPAAQTPLPAKSHASGASTMSALRDGKTETSSGRSCLCSRARRKTQTGIPSAGRAEHRRRRATPPSPPLPPAGASSAPARGSPAASQPHKYTKRAATRRSFAPGPAAETA